MPPGFAFCPAVAFFQWTQPAPRAMPQSLLRKQLLTGVVESLGHANCHQLHPEQSQQLGSLAGDGFGGLLPACLPLGLWKAIALDP